MHKQLPAASLDDLVVRPGSCVLDVMRVIDRNGLEVALVCDDRRRLMATVTDGDIRRSLLAGGSLQDAILGVGCRNFTSVRPEVSRPEALRLMIEHGFKSIPVVDEAGVLVDLHTLQLALAGGRSESWAVIMAGGKGERLGDLTSAMPKPMLPVGDRPILERLVNLLVAHGFTRIFISVNYLGSMIEDHFGDGRGFHCRIEYLRETHPMGTGGALSLLPGCPEQPVLVLNGDLVTNINLTRMLQFHRSGGFSATVALREHVVKVPFGVVEYDGPRIRALREKPSLHYHINAGIYLLEPVAIAQVRGDRLFPITELIEGCLSQGQAVGAYPIQEAWNDVGLPEEYHKAQA